MENDNNSTIHQIEDVCVHFFDVLTKIINGELPKTLIQPLFLEFNYHYGEVINRDRRLSRIFSYANSIIDEVEFERRDLEKVLSKLKQYV